MYFILVPIVVFIESHIIRPHEAIFPEVLALKDQIYIGLGWKRVEGAPNYVNKPSFS